jgi:cytochrome P450
MREEGMSKLDEIDYFFDPSLLADSHPYFDHLRAKGPVVRMPNYDNVVVVTGYDEGVAVFRDDERFSTVISPNGPLPPLPFTPEGDDITEQIEAHRHLIPGANNLATMDPPAHTRLRSLLNGMITPKRLKDNEAHMAGLADLQIDSFIDRGGVELLAEYAQPFSTNVIANLMGVPSEDYGEVTIERATLAGQIGMGGAGRPNNPYEKVMDYFTRRIEERRRDPRQDVMSELAHTRYADGSLPSVHDVVMIVVQVFGAGQDTTTRVIAAALRILAENADLQRRLREKRELIPAFVEETLRLYSTTKSDFRLVKKPAKVGELDVAPGTIVMLAIAAMDRDPRRFEHPHEMQVERHNAREHVAFGRGIHSCIGAPLARAEIRVTVERFLQRMADIRIDEAKHGPAGARRYEYIPTYLLQGLAALHLTFRKA